MNIERISQIINESEQQAKALYTPEIARFITRSREHLWGSHTTVTPYPLDAIPAIDPKHTQAHSIPNLPLKESANIYIHCPHCGYPCKFCHYATLNNQGRDLKYLDPYFEALGTEMKMWAKLLQANRTKVSSIYIGGGTPLALSYDRLARLLQKLKETFECQDSPQICIETSPRATIEKDFQRKLELLKAHGLSRISIGIQSFNHQTLVGSGRTFTGHAPEDEFQAVQILMDSGIPNVNVDMMQDLPLHGDVSNTQRLITDLHTISQLRPHHITWYTTRLRPESQYAQTLKRAQTPEVNILQSISTRLAIWKVLEEIRYDVLEGDRFKLPGQQEDSFRKIRGSVNSGDLIGMGVSAYSRVGPHIFRNAHLLDSGIRADTRIAVQKYIDMITTYGHAVTHGYQMLAGEILAGEIVSGLKTGLSIRSCQEQVMFEPDAAGYDASKSKLIHKLFALGMLRVEDQEDDGIVHLTTLGRIFENEICALFYPSSATEQACRNTGIDPASEILEELKIYGSTASSIGFQMAQKTI